MLLVGKLTISMVMFNSYVELPVGNVEIVDNVNPGSINRKRLFNWEGAISVANHDFWGNTPPNTKTWFIDPVLILD